MGIEKFYKYKNKYSDRVLLLKEGNFYVSYNIDALILKEYFIYKLIHYEEFIKISIPLGKLKYVANVLNKDGISISVIETSLITYNFIIEKNKYDEIFSYHLVRDTYKTRMNRYIDTLDNQELIDICSHFGIN